MKVRTRFNIIANFVGRSWSSLMTLVFVPLYIKFMGVEAYGLVGFFVTLRAVISLLDLGFSTTLNRELARFSVGAPQGREVADTARTIEALYWVLALVTLGLTTALAPLLAHHWINSKALPVEAVTDAIRLMGLVITFSFPFGLYTGGLMGLQRQVLVNIINVILGTLRGVGAVLVLWLISPTIQAFFIWQATVAVLETAVAMTCLWHVLPGKFFQAAFRYRILRRVGRFAAGMSGIGISAILLSQVDKIILIKLLPLEVFGYYALAVTIGSGIQALLVYPISNAVFPRLTQLVKIRQMDTLAEFYHQVCQLISALIIPIGLTIILFSREVLLLWTRDVSVADNAHLILSVVMAGYLLNSAIIIPNMLQLANGWTTLILSYNIICVCVLLPALFVGVHFYGVIGGATILLIQNACYLLFIIPRMHRTILTAEKGRWYRSDLGSPLAAGLLSGAGLWLISFYLPVGPIVKIVVVMGGVGAAVLMASIKIRSLVRVYVGELYTAILGGGR